VNCPPFPISLSFWVELVGACNSITPIFGDDDGVLEFQQELPCQIQQFPIKYLGVPLSTDPLPRGAVCPIVNKVAAKLVLWHGSLMSK
jgi:hypothetical protein